MKHLIFGLLLFVYSHHCLAKNIKFIVFIDRSSSMSKYSHKLAKLSDMITQKFKNRCGQFDIAVSEIDYIQKGSKSAEIIGQPKYITESTPGASNLLKSRIRFGSDEGFCGEICASREKGFKEVTYSSIVQVVEKEQLNLLQADYVATLLLTNTVPVFEQYQVDEALDKIYSLLPKDKFVAASISHTEWDEENKKCVVDRAGTDFLELSKYHLNALNRFSTQSGGYAFNICRSIGYQQLLEEYINLVIANAGCLLMM